MRYTGQQRTSRRRRGAALLAVLAAGLAAAATPRGTAQSTLPQEEVERRFDTGWVDGGPARAVAAAGTIEVAGATWLRVRFATAVLGDAPPDGPPTVIRITSRLDGAVQVLDAVALRQWGHRSAYFNGDAVSIELITARDAAPSRLTVESVTAGIPAGGVATLCADDDRVASDDPRVARLVPSACTAWMIDDERRCFLTAGHCGLAGNAVVQFNVPPSDASGNEQHPPPADQYPIDPASIVMANTGIGDDWAYFGCFPNSETGMTPYEVQGDAFTLEATPRSDALSVRITGYGADDSPPQADHTQQSATGPLTGFGLMLEYEVDTTNGSSGSPVVDDATGAAIGIHTNGGCIAGAAGNRGTSLENGALQLALQSPLGVCRPKPPVLFAFPDGLPDPVHPLGELVRVEVSETGAGTPFTGPVALELDAGAGFTTIELATVAPGVFDAPFPPAPCGTALAYYFVASVGEKGHEVTSPAAGPDAPYTTVAAAAYDVVFHDDFQTDTGWTVDADPELEDGAWQRGVPEGGGDRGDPATDADGSGNCYVTGLADGNTDVDGGWTSLTSPRLDATEGDAHLAYARWFSNSAGAVPSEDVLLVELSSDDGGTWSTVEVVGPEGPGTAGGWVHRVVRIADVTAPTDLVRFRVTAADVGAPSIVEAGLDAVRLSRSAAGIVCSACPGDVTRDGVVGVDDIIEVLLAWGVCRACPADVDENGVVDVDDLLAVLASWACTTTP